MTASTDPPQPEPPSADGSLEELPLNDAATVSALILEPLRTRVPLQLNASAVPTVPSPPRSACPRWKAARSASSPSAPTAATTSLSPAATANHMQIRACLRWETTCPYCKQPTVARVPPPGAGRRKELTPCASCRKPLVVERREEGKLVLRAHRGIIEGTLL